MRPLLPLALLLSGCAAAPQSVSDCARLADATRREDCRLAQVKAAVEDPSLGPREREQALDAALAQIDDPQSRDLVLLRMAVGAPEQAAELCRRVRTAGAREKCRQVIGRPHLRTSPDGPPPAPDSRAGHGERASNPPSASP